MRKSDYEEFGLNLDTFWLKEESLENLANLPPTDIIAA
jgi:hypothetical protein